MFVYAKPEQKQTSKNTVQKKEPEKTAVSPNQTGIPDAMKTRFENLSGFSFDDVRVHYNSYKPAQLQALAYTKGSQVYVAPGQEKHLGHELGHVVQQKKMTVPASKTIGGLPVNTDERLEAEANRFGESVVQRKVDLVVHPSTGSVVQMLLSKGEIQALWRNGTFNPDEYFERNHFVDAGTNNIKRAIIHGRRDPRPGINTTFTKDTALGAALANNANTWSDCPDKEGCKTVKTAANVPVQDTYIKETTPVHLMQQLIPAREVTSDEFMVGEDYRKGDDNIVTKIGGLVGGVTQENINTFVRTFKDATVIPENGKRPRQKQAIRAYKAQLTEYVATQYNIKLRENEAQFKTTQETNAANWARNGFTQIGATNEDGLSLMTYEQINAIPLIQKKILVDVTLTNARLTHLSTE